MTLAMRWSRRSLARIGRGVDRCDPKLLSVGLFLLLLIAYMATGNVSRDGQSPDPVAAALPAWQWANHHTLYLDHVLTFNPWIYRPLHHLVSNRTPGVVFFGIPFYLAFGQASVFSMFPAVMAAAFAAAGAVTFLVSALRRVLPPRFALLCGLVVAFGTATWSVSADTLWTHGPDELMLAAAMYFLARGSNRAGSLAIALCVPIRAHTAVFAFVAGIWFAIRRRSLWPLLTFGAPSAVSLGLVSLYNHWIMGTWSIQGAYSYVDPSLAQLGLSGPTSLPLNLFGALFSPDRGVLIWCPVILVLLVSIRPAWRCAPDWVKISAVAGIGYLLIQAKINYFTGGDRFWSYRLTIEPLMLVTPLLALAARETFQRHWSIRGLTAAAAIYGVGTQAIGGIFYSSYDLYRHSPWTYSHLAASVEVGGLGPKLVMSATVALMLAAMGFARVTRTIPGDPAVVGQPPSSSGDEQVEVVAGDG